jgi:hypothetical protein
MSNSNLPVNKSQQQDQKVKDFFNNYFDAPITFPAAEIDTVVGFFKRRGFDDIASNSTAMVLMQQANIDSINVFELLDTLKGLTEIQLSAVVAEILNYNRQKNSVLGYKRVDTVETLERRNIII